MVLLSIRAGRAPPKTFNFEREVEMIRSIGAVLVAIVVWGILWVGAGAAINAAAPDRFTEAGGTNDSAILGVFIAISFALSLLAGFLCARIAARWSC